MNAFVKEKNPSLCKLEKLVKSFRYDMSQRAVIKKHADANAIRTYDNVNLDLKDANKSTLRVLPLDNRHYKQQTLKAVMDQYTFSPRLYKSTVAIATARYNRIDS